MSRRCMGCMESFSDEYNVCPYCGYVVGTKAEEAIHMDPGTVLHNRYVVGRVLGFGGFGITYIGWDGKLEQKVAIKEYLPGEFSTRMPGQSQVTVFNGEKSEQFRDGLKKFVGEAKRLAKFQNEPGIVKIFDSFEENETAYIIMEFLDGVTLLDYLKEHGTIPEDDAVKMLMPIMESLQVVHAEGILHRDIAPDNIFITKAGDIELIDFGASRYATTTHSRSLTVIVKPGYSPEEQYRSRGDQGPHTDVYAIAATLYRMITGKTPPDAMERRAKFESENKDILVEPHKLNKKISLNRENAILNALNVRIEDRTPDIPSFIAELQSDTPAKRRYGKIKKIDLYHWPLWAKIAASTLLVAMLTFGALLLTGVIKFSKYTSTVVIPDNIVLAPDVEGLDNDEALRIIAASNLIAKTEGSIESEFIKPGTIIVQNPVGGSYIEKNGIIYVTVSAGKVQEVVDGIATVPSVIWKTEDDAIATLRAAGLSNFNIEYARDNNVDQGCVISQNPEVNEKVPEETQITIVVSLGPEAIHMPNVIGMNQSEAAEMLLSMGLKCTVQRENNSSVPDEEVFEQSISEGEEVYPGDTIIITVSSGKKIVEVPDVVGMKKEQAEKTLKQKGFRVAVVENYDDNAPAGTVISQNPGKGTTQEEGSTVTITVSKGKAFVNVTNVKLKKHSLTLKVGETDTLQATIEPKNATNQTLSWSSSDESVVKVDSAGKVKAIGEGTAKITVTAGGGSVSDSCKVTVSPNKTSVTGVTLDHSSLTLNIGDRATLKASIQPSNATDKSVTWSTSNSSVASVSSNGAVTCVGEGTAVITVTTNDGNYTAKCTVTGIKPVVHVTGVTLDKTKLTLTQGQTHTLIATISPYNATDKSVTWSSSNSSVASVTSSGKVTAVSPGSATITVKTTDGSHKATCAVTVAPNVIHVTGVSLNTSSISLNVNKTYTLVAIVAPSNATNKTVTWSTSNANIATVSSNGVVMARAAGKAVITATTVDGGYSASCNVTVYPNTFVVTFNPNGGSVSPTSMTMTVGQPFGTLPTPHRDYYTFKGWFTSSGTQITSNTVMSSAENFTVYAHWESNPVSGWVPISQMPSGAQIVEEKWTYTLTTTVESTSTSMSGYVLINSYWRQTGCGNFEYASFPTGYDTNNWYYQNWNRSPYESYENSTSKRVASNSWAGWIYWHWMYSVSYANTTTRTISHRYGYWNPNGGQSGAGTYLYQFFTAIASSVDCPYLDRYYCCSQNLPSYNCHSIITNTTNVGTPRMFRFDYRVCNYTDYEKVFVYQKTENLESWTEVTPSDTISNVVHWVRYREK